MNADSTLAQRIYEQVQTLPEESLLELARYVEFLKFKADRRRSKRPLRIIKLGGILEGYDFSPEMLAEARREIWGNFANTDL